MSAENFLLAQLKARAATSAYRRLAHSSGIDFSSNDYLGFAQNAAIAKRAAGILAEHELYLNGATGSRLISGNSELCEELEKKIAAFHEAEAGLIYNSGYDANLGFFPCIAHRGDTILYDYLSHASIRDGIRLSNANAFSFAHNDLNELEKKLQKATGNIFVAVEAIYSMDGDEAPLKELSVLCEKYNASLVVDEAHSSGIYGDKGEGLVCAYGLANKVFARLHTFGKALGCHGAIWLGSKTLREYLINFSRSFIYTTAMPAHNLAVIHAAYEILPSAKTARQQLFNNINRFKSHFDKLTLSSGSAIQSIIIPGNIAVVEAAAYLQEQGFNIKAIRYPTVPEGQERLRVILHSYNTAEQIDDLAQKNKN